MKKKMNYKRIISILLVLIIWAAILLFFIDTKTIYGEWECEGNFRIEFSRTRSFEFYDNSNKDESFIEGKYKVERLKEKLPKIKYKVVFENETEAPDEFYKEITILSSQTKLNEMTIIEKDSNTKYTCKRVK